MSKIEDLISTFAFCFTNNKMKHIVDRKNQCRVWGMLFCLFLLCVSVSCQRDGDNLYNDVNDVADKRLAVYKGALTDSLTKNVFPLADIKNYEKTLDMFLDMEAGKRDAVIMDIITATKVLDINTDYVCLGELNSIADKGKIVVVIPKRMYAPLAHEEVNVRGIFENCKEYISRNILNKESRHLIIGGFYTTVLIFLGAAVIAFFLAILLTYMGINHKWGWLYHPLHWFVFTIHDIPSVVLMMFFYYVVFAGVSMSGILVAAIALGVYSSASLTKIFKIHICQISKEQREAGLMLGLTSYQVYRYIIFPQAVRSMQPLVVAEMKLLLRSTSYAGYIAQKDLVKAVDAIRGVTFDAFFPLLIVSLLYLLLSWLIAKGLNTLGQKMFAHD